MPPVISGVPHFFMGLLETGNHKALHEGGATSLRIILLIENHSCKFLKSLHLLLQPFILRQTLFGVRQRKSASKTLACQPKSINPSVLIPQIPVIYVHKYPCGYREVHQEGGSFGSGFYLNCGPMSFGNAITDRQSQAGAIFLGSKKGGT